jgi:hypothetical protein
VKYKKEILVEGIVAGVEYRFSYPYLDCTSHEDVQHNQRRGIAGLLDSGDELEDGTLVIDRLRNSEEEGWL